MEQIINQQGKKIMNQYWEWSICKPFILLSPPHSPPQTHAWCRLNCSACGQMKTVQLHQSFWTVTARISQGWVTQTFGLFWLNALLWSVFVGVSDIITLLAISCIFAFKFTIHLFCLFARLHFSPQTLSRGHRCNCTWLKLHLYLCHQTFLKWPNRLARPLLHCIQKSTTNS